MSEENNLTLEPKPEEVEYKDNSAIETEAAAEESGVVVEPLSEESPDGKKGKKKKDKKEKKPKENLTSEQKTRQILIAIISVGCILFVVSIAGMIGTAISMKKAQNQPEVESPTTNQYVVVPNAPSPTNPSGNNATEVTTASGDNNEGGNVSANAPQTDEQWLTFFNTALNKVKSDAPSFTKAKQTQTADIKLSNSLAQTVVGAQKDKYLSNETVTTNVNKGDKAAAQASFSPDGAAFASNLTLGDIKAISHQTDASGNYVIKIEMNDCSNPDLNSPFAKIFTFMLVDDVMNTYAPDMGATVDRANVSLKFSNCYATATISPDGKVVSYETFVGANMILKDAKIKVVTTDLDATLNSTTKYTNFGW